MHATKTSQVVKKEVVVVEEVKVDEIVLTLSVADADALRQFADGFTGYAGRNEISSFMSRLHRALRDHTSVDTNGVAAAAGRRAASAVYKGGV